MSLDTKISADALMEWLFDEFIAAVSEDQDGAVETAKQLSRIKAYHEVFKKVMQMRENTIQSKMIRKRLEGSKGVHYASTN